MLVLFKIYYSYLFNPLPFQKKKQLIKFFVFKFLEKPIFSYCNLKLINNFIHKKKKKKNTKQNIYSRRYTKMWNTNLCHWWSYQATISKLCRRAIFSSDVAHQDRQTSIIRCFSRKMSTRLSIRPTGSPIAWWLINAFFVSYNAR